MCKIRSAKMEGGRGVSNKGLAGRTSPKYKYFGMVVRNGGNTVGNSFPHWHKRAWLEIGAGPLLNHGCCLLFLFRYV